MDHQCCHSEESGKRIVPAAAGRERRLIDDLIGAMDHPHAVIAEIAVGSHFIGLRADDGGVVRAGLASTLGSAPDTETRRLLDELPGQSLAQAAELLKAADGFSVGLGAAALNAGISPPENQPDLDASLIMAEKGRDGETVLVGDFPFTQWLRQQVKTLYLFELRDVPGRVAPDQWDTILKRCDVLGLTGTTLLTRAMANYLDKAPQAYTVIIGPTTPMTPVMFTWGADVLAGAHIVDPEPVFAGIRKGLSYREFKDPGVQFAAWTR
jgi:uncharacterized protein (DUF4213/DUF364 family)